MEVGKMPAQRKTNQSRRLTAAGLIAVTAGTLLMMAWAIFPTPALATHVEPELQLANPPCPAGTTELKVEPVVAGQYTDGTLIVNVALVTLAGGPGFNWTSNIGLDAVIAKGGPNGNVYLYNPEATADTGLHAPVNPNNNQFFGLSHISFCYDKDVTPDLGITKSATSTQVTEGGAVSYTITVTNTGNADATGVVVTDDLDDALSAVSATFDGPGQNDVNCTVGAGNNQITCNIGTLGPNESATVTINATAPQLPLTVGGQCTLQLLNKATVDSNQTTPETSNQVTVTVTGTGCEGGGGGGGGGVAPTTTTTTTTIPSVAPTTIHKSTATDEVLPTTVTPGGTAFTGVEDVVPIGAIALTLMTSGSGLLWAGARRRRRDGSEDED
jgi:uncharacterized repeat protein (TIGR01451 family)